MTGATATKAVDVAIPAGTTQLRLDITNGGDNLNYDHADWARRAHRVRHGGGDTTPPDDHRPHARARRERGRSVTSPRPPPSPRR